MSIMGLLIIKLGNGYGVELLDRMPSNPGHIHMCHQLCFARKPCEKYLFQSHIMPHFRPVGPYKQITSDASPFVRALITEKRVSVFQVCATSNVLMKSLQA